MKYIKILSLLTVYFLASTLNFQLRAMNIEVPEKCSSSKSAEECAVLNVTSVLNQNINGVAVRALKGSSFVNKSAAEIQLIRGEFYIESRDFVILKTLYGAIRIENGSVLIEVKDHIVHFVATDGLVQYSPRGEVSFYPLPVGLSNFLTGITSSGVAQTSYPKPAELKTWLTKWAKFYTKIDVPKIAKKMQNFKQEWQVMTSQVGPWYLDVVEREIATHQADQARLARLKAEKDAESQKYKQLFRQRIFEP